MFLAILFAVCCIFHKSATGLENSSVYLVDGVFCNIQNRMAYIGVEFEENLNDDGGIALISSSWITPRKKEVFWPPYKKQEMFIKAVKKSEPPMDNWKLYKIRRCFFETDDFDKAQKKIKLAEVYSDVQSDLDQLEGSKRNRRPPRRLCDDSSDEDENCFSDNLSRPPAMKNAEPRGIQNKTPINISSFSQPTTSTVVTFPPKNFGQSSIHSDKNFQEVESTRFSHLNTTTDADATPRSTYTRNSLLNSGDFSKSSQEKIIALLAQIREQNIQIIGLLNEQQSTSSNLERTSLPNDVPVDFPVTNQEELQSLEGYLVNRDKFNQVSLYLKTLGGKDLVSRINNVLKRCLTNHLASNFNYMGKRQEKLPFRDLKLNKLIICAIKSGSEAAENDIENIIKIWLKHAPQRAKLDEKRRSKQYQY